MSENAAPSGGGKRKGRWRRRLIATLMVLVFLVLAFRLTLFWIMPVVLSKVGAAYDVNIQYDGYQLALLNGDVGLWNLRVVPRGPGGGEPLFRANYVRGDISTADLLRGRLHVLRMEADGVDLFVERTVDGRIPLLERFAVRKSAPVTQIDFTPPLTIEAMRLHKVSARIKDAAVEPTFDSVVSMDVRLSDYGLPGKSVRFEADAWAEGVMDSLRTAGHGNATGQTLDASARVSVNGLRPKALAGYLRPLGVHPVANALSAELNVALAARPLHSPTTQPQGSGPSTSTASGTANTGAAPVAVAATLNIEGVKLLVDGAEAASLGRLQIEAAELGPAVAKIAKVSVEGGWAGGMRTSAGAFRAAGFELVKAAESNARPSRAPGAESAPATPFEFSVAEMSARDLHATFRDERVNPPADLRLGVTDLRCTAQGDNALGRDATLDVSAAVALPNVARLVRLTGAVRPFSDKRTADLAFHADGVRPDALRPYLEAVGVQSLLKDASARGTVHASVAPGPGGAAFVDARLAEVAVADGHELLTFGQIEVKHAGLNPTLGRWQVEAVELSGPSLELRREADGSFTTAGLRLPARRPRSANETEPTAGEPRLAAAKALPSEGPTTAPAGMAVMLPRVEVGRLTWKGIRLTLTDESTQPLESFVIGDAGIELSNLLLDLQSAEAAASPKPGVLKIWLASPRFADELVVEGSLVPRARSLAADLRVRGRGVDLTRVANYLRPLGAEPLLKDGSLQLAAKAALTRENEQIRASLELSDLSLREGDAELAGFDKLRLDGVELSAAGLSLAAVEVGRPRIGVTRESDGAFTAAGIRVRLPSAQPAAPSAPPVVSVREMPAVAPATAPATAPANAPAVVLKQLHIDGAMLRWNDLTVTPHVQTAIQANVKADGFTLGRSAPPGTFDVTLAAESVADELHLAGSADLSPQAPAVSLKVEGRGLRAGPLSAYLPEGVDVSLKDGRLRAAIEASVAQNAAGGQGLRLDVRDLEYRDGADDPPLLGLESLAVRVPRADMEGNVIAVEEVSLAGLETRAERGLDGTTYALGLRLGPTTSPAAPAPDPRSPLAPSASQPSTGGAVDTGRLVAEARRPLPLVTVDKLDLNVRHAEWRDATRRGAAPAVLGDVRLRNLARIEVGGPAADTLPPAKLELTGQASPIAENFRLHAQVAPFATEPSAALDFSAAGIKGEGLIALAPDLATMIDGSKLTDGRLRAQVQAQAKFERRGPRDFDLSRGFELDLLLKDVAMTVGESGPVLAGVESLQADSLRIEPKFGRVHAKVLEISKPVAIASRESDGIHVLNLVIKPVARNAGATRPPADRTESPVPASTSLAQTGASPGAPAKGEIRVDRLLVSGLDVRFEDHSVDPPVAVPLNNLDVEVRGLTTLALSEPRPVRFSAVVGADKVPLPKRPKGAGIAGSIGDVAGLLGGKSDEQRKASVEIEQRELFSQITAAGNMTLYPTPKGYVKSSVNGLELAAFKGLGRESGVDLSGGVFDGTVEASFREDGSLDGHARLVLTDLAVSEPANGPIARHLGLSAPLDVVIQATQDLDGSITIPLSVPVEKGKVNGAAVAASATGALAQVLTTAVASAPIKAVGGVGGLLGLDAGASNAKQGPAPIELSFAAGDATLSDGARRQIAKVAELMRKDPTVELTVRQELGGGDLTLAGERANPPAAECLALAGMLRARKAELVAARRGLAAQTRAELAAAPESRVRETVNRLRDLDRRIAAAEDAADALYDILRPGADRQATRRTRAAALQIAQQRLDVVRDAFLAAASGVPKAVDRVRTTNAQFNPSQELNGGRIVVVVVQKKRT